MSLDTLPSQLSFKKIASLLKSRFGSENFPELWKATLETRPRRNNEKLTEQSGKIMEMAERVFPKADMEIRSNIATNYFIRALQDKEQQRHIRCQGPDSFETALRLALAYKKAQKIEEKQEMTSRQNKIRSVKKKPGNESPQTFPKGRGCDRSKKLDKVSQVPVIPKPEFDILVKKVDALTANLAHSTKRRPIVKVPNDQ